MVVKASEVLTPELIASVVNKTIQDIKVDTNLISDGYHTFGELYDHRITLFIALLKLHTESEGRIGRDPEVWRSTAHSDGSVWEGWFILGMGKQAGEQITYHLPLREWDNCQFAETIDMAPEWDGHSSSDVLQRLKELL